MGLTVYRFSAILLILTTGCSASGIFGAKGKSSVSESFASNGDAGEMPNRSAASTPAAKGTPDGRAATLDPALRRRKVSEHLAQAARAEQSGDVRAARAAYERVLQLEPEHSSANYQLAVIADNESRFDDADRHYQVLLRKSPQNPDLLASLGWSYLLQGRYDESERTLRDALSINPKHRTALYNLGWLYGTLGDYDHALEIFRVAGNEADAQHAMAELFPKGRPTEGPRSPTTAPRNPFRSASRDVAGGNARPGGRAQDRLAGGAVSAPAPWQGAATSKQPDSPLAAPGSGRASKPSADRASAARDDGQFEEVFSRLETRNGSASLPRENADLTLDAPAEVRGRSTGHSEEIQPTGFELPEAAPSGDGPLITPKAKTSPTAVRGREELEPLPVERASQTAQPPNETANETARPDRQLPDWPYHTESSRRVTSGSTNDEGSRPGPRTAAALLGLGAGPGGLPFPTIIVPPNPGAAR